MTRDFVAYGFLATVVDVGKPWRFLTGRYW